MKHILSIGLSVIVLLAGGPPAGADLWDQLTKGGVRQSQEVIKDPTGFTYRGRTTFVPPSGAGGGTIADFGGDLGRGCSAFDFAGSFRALFDANALERYTIGLAANALAGAPVLLLCYTSPTLCDLYKHLKALTQAQLAANQQACEAIQTSAEGFGRSMRSTAVKACLDEKAAQGVPIHVAIQECSRLDPGQSVLNLQGLPIGTGSYNVVDAALSRAGAPRGQIELAKAVTGQVLFNTTGPGGRATIQPPPTGAVMAKYQEYFDESQEKLVRLVDATAGGRPPTVPELQDLGGFGIVVTPQLLAAVSQLPPGRRELAVNKLAAALARIRLETQLGEIRTQMRAVAISERGGHREELMQRAEQLEAMIEHVRRIEAAQNAIAGPAQAIFEEAERQRALQAPHTVRPVDPTVPGFRGERGGMTEWPAKK